uniref:Uncharacterized protein n=1 Tax=Helianthus annuus TaxID=4232 RepID=A0A251SCB3_HELAN
MDLKHKNSLQIQEICNPISNEYWSIGFIIYKEGFLEMVKSKTKLKLIVCLTFEIRSEIIVGIRSEIMGFRVVIKVLLRLQLRMVLRKLSLIAFFTWMTILLYKGR